MGSLCKTSISDGVIINCYTLLLFHFVQMNSTFVDNDTLSSLLHLYRQCKERGETVSLSLDTRDGNNFVTFSVKSIVNTNVRNEFPENRNTVIVPPEENEKKCQ